nr:ABC transporter transmembrane domain-containing protein [Candidatus Cloacimonadota bacterium]
MKTFEKIIPFLKKNLLVLIGGIIILIIVDVGQLYTIKILQKAIDDLGKTGFTSGMLLKAALLIVAITVVITILRYFWRLAFIGTSWVMDRDLRQMYYEHLMKLSANFYNKAKTGDLMAYATNDLNAVRMLFSFGFVVGADIVVIVFLSLIFMIDINLKLTLISIIPMPFLTFILMYFSKKIHVRFHRVQKTFATMSGIVQESISGIRVVKAFGQEEAELSKLEKSADEYVNDNIDLVKIVALFHPMMFLLVNICMGIILIYGGQSVILQDISMGEFVAFFQYLGMLVWPMIAIGWITNMYQRGTASLKRLNSIYGSKPEITDEDCDNDITSLQGNICVQNLTFSYQPDLPPVFKDISFEIGAGKTLAIVGRTGCGKTSLIDLFSRVYNPPHHSIFLDGNDIYRVPLAVLRSDMVMVPQEIFLFSDTVANNIRLGKNDATRAEVEEVSKQAQIYEAIQEFDHGYDTVIGERGVTLSGGQKQRLAIARAL